MEIIFYFFTHVLPGVLILVLFFCIVFIACFINAYAFVSFVPVKTDLNNRTGIAGVITIICCVIIPYKLFGHSTFFDDNLHLLVGGITGCSWAALKYRRSPPIPHTAGTTQPVSFYLIPLKLFGLLGKLLGFGGLGIIISYLLEKIFRLLFWALF
jgi:hypothetical protein